MDRIRLNASFEHRVNTEVRPNEDFGRSRQSTPLAMLRRMIAMRTSLRNGFGFEI
jgi:hypothetical protein